MKNEKRLNIEALRILAIICTIMIHVTNVYSLNYAHISHEYYFFSVLFNSLARICVPIFFMISGALLVPKEEDMKKYGKRIIKFIIILIVWSLVYMLIYNKLNFKNIALSFFSANNSSRHLWYLYALLGIYLVLPFIRKMCTGLSEKEENLFLILWGILSGLQIIYMPLIWLINKGNVQVQYPVPIVEATYYLGYFVCGHILYKRFSNYKKKKYTNLFLILGYIDASLVTALVTYFMSIRNNNYYDVFLWYRSIFITISAVCIFLLFIINKDKFKSEKILWFSKYTFGVYLIHVEVLLLLKKVFAYSNYSSLLMTIPVTLIVYLVSLLIAFILKKIPLIKELL